VRIATLLAAVMIFVAGGLHSLKVARHPTDLEHYRRRAVGRVDAPQMARRFKVIGVASISTGLWLLLAALAFRGDVISWATLLLPLAATVGLVMLTAWRLRLL
jgi:hypothetical protein